MPVKRLVKSILPGLVLLAGAARAEGADAPGPKGDPAEGRALFVGARKLARGGPPCGACHGIGGEGRAFAATYGPDLSDAHATLGDDGLDAVLTELSFPSMAPLYDGRPLEAGERADLAAFLGAKRGGAQAGETAAFALQGGAAAAAVLGALFLAGRRRLRPVRKTLVDRAPRGAPGGGHP